MFAIRKPNSAVLSLLNLVCELSRLPTSISKAINIRLKMLSISAPGSRVGGSSAPSNTSARVEEVDFGLASDAESSGIVDGGDSLTGGEDMIHKVNDN